MQVLFQIQIRMRVELMIPTKDIANIKVSEDVKYSFEALPYREYGFLEGKIENLSPDSKVDSEKRNIFLYRRRKFKFK